MRAFPNGSGFLVRIEAASSVRTEKASWGLMIVMLVCKVCAAGPRLFAGRIGGRGMRGTRRRDPMMDGTS